MIYVYLVACIIFAILFEVGKNDTAAACSFLAAGFVIMALGKFK